MIGSLNKSQIDYLLRGEMVGRIGCSAKGITYIVPVTYVYDGEFIYGHTKEGLKVELMRKNPSICFEVDKITDLANWQSVIIQGTYEELRGRKAEDVVQSIMNRVHPMTASETLVPRYSLEKRSIPARRGTKVVVFRIRIDEATGRFEKQ